METHTSPHVHEHVPGTEPGSKGCTFSPTCDARPIAHLLLTYTLPSGKEWTRCELVCRDHLDSQINMTLYPNRYPSFADDTLTIEAVKEN